MSKNIVICCDGTGNRGGKTRGTNVWRMFKAVDRHSADPPQLTYYDDGVGTDDLRWIRLMGGAFGWGLSRNIRQAYAFLCLNYEPGDHVFLFGFSRGAFTVRSLAGMVLDVGLLSRDAVLSAGNNRERMLKKLLRAHRSIPNGAAKRWRHARARSLGGYGCGQLRKDLRIHFIGVWDTVDAVGVPFDWMKKPIKWVSQLVVRLRAWQFACDRLDERVNHAYQALALDDERKTFQPNLWQTADGNADCHCDERIEQVWFAGAHSNVGGGYPKDALALVSLDWMMQKAAARGLAFAMDALTDVQRDADAHGRIYDSRTGLQAFYRYAQRRPYCNGEQHDGQCRLPRVHVSVIRRIRRRTNFYASRVLQPTQPDGRPPVKCRVVGTQEGPFALVPDEDVDSE